MVIEFLDLFLHILKPCILYINSLSPSVRLSDAMVLRFNSPADGQWLRKVAKYGLCILNHQQNQPTFSMAEPVRPVLVSDSSSSSSSSAITVCHLVDPVAHRFHSDATVLRFNSPTDRQWLRKVAKYGLYILNCRQNWPAFSMAEPVRPVLLSDSSSSSSSAITVCHLVDPVAHGFHCTNFLLKVVSSR